MEDDPASGHSLATRVRETRRAHEDLFNRVRATWRQWIVLRSDYIQQHKKDLTVLADAPTTTLHKCQAKHCSTPDSPVRQVFLFGVRESWICDYCQNKGIEKVMKFVRRRHKLLGSE